MTALAAAPAKAGVAAAATAEPSVIAPAAFDTSKPLRELAETAEPSPLAQLPPEQGRFDMPSLGGGALQTAPPATPWYDSGDAVARAAIAGTVANFEGLRNTDNPDGLLVNPPDPVGDVGPHHYVEMVNVAFAVFDKQGNRLLGPTPIGALWEGFAIPECTELAGDPIVLYDQLENRWLLTQFTTGATHTPPKTSYNCIAVSTTGDPTGTYYRYAFSTDLDGLPFFPDYPKYGVWSNSYLLTSRDFGPNDRYGISVYGLEKSRMVSGDPNARAVRFVINGDIPGNLPLIGDGLLPADLDGSRLPSSSHAPAPVVGTQDDNGPYGATFDAVNVWELSVQWAASPIASLRLAAQLPVAPFNSIFPCAPTTRDCLPQPGVTDRDLFLDILSYRQRPTWRLAYRNFGPYEAMVTNQSVEARPGVAGVRWYELRRTDGVYSVYQQGTFAPNDGVHRWMGSIAQDRNGNTALGYSVVNGHDVYPGIRYTGRLAGDPLGEMTLGEGVIVNGSGVQLTPNSRWGDYTSMNVDPGDDCTFWYVNEYYATTDPVLLRNWQTRIASFRLPGC
jgi:hypothetical protein